MATIEVDVEIDIKEHLDKVKTEDLIEELSYRNDGDVFMIRQIKSIQPDNASIAKALTDNLADEMKMEEFLEVFKDIRQDALTTFLDKYK